MRRILSILLVIGLGLGQMLAAVPAAAFSAGVASGWTGKLDESRLPACCRRNGKHHCAMSAMGQSSDSARETSVNATECCPSMPRALVSTAPSLAALAHPAASVLKRSTEPYTVLGHMAAVRMTHQRSWPKRGPPSLQTILRNL